MPGRIMAESEEELKSLLMKVKVESTGSHGGAVDRSASAPPLCHTEAPPLSPRRPRTAAYQSPPAMGFSRQEYWSGLPLPSLSSV